MSPVLTTGAGTFPAIASSSSVIKSIQQRSINLAAGTSTATDTGFTPVTAANTVVFFNGVTTDLATANYGRAGVRVTLTNGTTVTAVRENNTTSAATVYYTIVEFASGVNSIQYGNVAIANPLTTGTTAISAVGSNAFVMWLGASVATGGLNFGDIISGCTLTSNILVTCNIGAAVANTLTTNFVVVDLDSSIVSSVQQRTLTSAAGSATDSDTLSAVTTANTILAYGGYTGPTNSGSSPAAYAGTLTSTTNVTYTRIGTGGVSRSHYYTAVVLNSSALSANAVQRPGSGKIAITAGTSNTATITSVNTAKSFVNWTGITAPNANPNTIMTNIVLTNGTTVTASVTSSGTTTAGFEAVEFA